MKPTTYDPIPPHVREAYELFRTAAEEAGFRVTPATLHTDAVLAAGEDRAIAFLDHVTRYWPTCGAPGLGLIGKSPVTLEEFGLQGDGVADRADESDDPRAHGVVRVANNWIIKRIIALRANSLEARPSGTGLDGLDVRLFCDDGHAVHIGCYTAHAVNEARTWLSEHGGAEGPEPGAHGESNTDPPAPAAEPVTP
jgi:hypothetical protein